MCCGAPRAASSGSVVKKKAAALKCAKCGSPATKVFGWSDSHQRNVKFVQCNDASCGARRTA